MQPLVSIISPTYNGATYLPSFLDSIYNQTYNNIELIIINDGSTDSTKIIIDSYRQKFENRSINLIYEFQENKGQAAAINLALTKISSQSKFFMWVDSDDVLMKDNVLHKVQFLQQHPEFDLCLCNAVFSEYGSNYTSKPLTWRKAFSNGTLFENFLFGKNIVAGFGQGTVLVKKELLEKAIPQKRIYESRQGQNWQLMLPFTWYGKSGHLDEVLFKYIIHNDSHSHTKRTFEKQIERFTEFEILISETLIKIVDMKDSERVLYLNKIHEKYLKEKLSISYSMKHFLFAKKLKMQMRMENFLIPVYLRNFVFYFVYKTLRRIVYAPFIIFGHIRKVLRVTK